MRYTKIVATLGPAVAGEAGVGKLMDAGADVFRCNASHGSPEDRAAQIAAVRASAAARGRQACVLLDLQGPKIRLGRFEGGRAELCAGQEFTISTSEAAQAALGNANQASTSYSEFARDVKTGDRVLLCDGTVALRVVSADGTAARCVVETGGLIGDRKGINLPGVEVSTPALTREDKINLTAALAVGVDLVALSFVRRKDDILRLRHFLEEKDVNLPIVAKIEKPEAWEHLDEILEVSDGVMVARGDLGVELALEKVPYVQKAIIQRARERNVFVITATQMLESMIENPVPTRAEVSDVANAIYDGSDAVMLSAETSVGKYPAEAVAQMARIAIETEKALGAFASNKPLPAGDPLPAAIVARAACEAAATLKAAAIIVFTTTGGIARRVSRHRPGVPVYAFTPDEAIARQAQVLFGVESIIAARASSSDEMMSVMDRSMVARGLAKPGEMVVFLSGQPIGKPGSTNTLILHKVVG